MTYHPKVIGKKCYLSPVRMEDAGTYTRWFNDLEVQKNLIIPVPIITLESEKEWITNIGKREDTVVFAIVEKKGNTLIGNAGLHQINLRNRSAEFGIVIGEKKFWGKGFGTEATMLVLDYGFNVLNLHSIYLNAYAYNERGLGCYRKCGFKEVGRRREAKCIAGKFWDEVCMDILDREFKSPFVKGLMK